MIEIESIKLGLALVEGSREIGLKMEKLEDFVEFGEIEEGADYYYNLSDEDEYEQRLIFGKEETIGNDYFNDTDFRSYNNELFTFKREQEYLKHCYLVSKMKEKKIIQWGKFNQNQLQATDSDEENFNYSLPSLIVIKIHCTNICN